MPSRILYLSRYEACFGGGRCLINLVRCLDRQHYEPFVMLPPGAVFAQELRDLGARVEELQTSIPSTWRHLRHIASLNVALIRFVRRERIDIVHINEESCLITSLIPFLLYCKLARIPYIVHHRSAGIVFDALTRFLLLRGHVICISKAVHREFTAPRRSDVLARPSQRNVSLIYDGIDTAAFAAVSGGEAVRKEFGLNGDVVVGYVSAIDPRKRQELFLQAAKRVAAKHANVRFLVVGDTYDGGERLTRYKQQMLALRDELGLREQVIFTGYRTDVPRIMQAMDICVLTSKTEGLGDVVIEAMAAGKPVVSTADGGPAELVEDGATGYLVRQHGDASAYAERIAELVADGPARRRMGREGARQAMERFDVRSHARAIEALYERLLTDAGRSR
ncbi:MAG: hypothetical protein COV75_04050 [Candidatus Omnitrophica bacterium CG11_big_fil_rev_8_21_14_0_20_63_9]|nr:MAG: hypothetical protein COV75_04050 [Candidatus Omnitrophica bacterium CG11_big_fil_rev_8_21_14_0_20_63_9]